MKAIEQFWVQYHGLPNVLRCDPEGSFRSNALAQWAQRRGVDIRPCAAEDHGQIGAVERLIRKLKDDARTLLRSEDMDPWLGILAVITAHNQLDRIGGYAPAQWAYGRLPDFDGRLFEGGNSVPFHSTEGTLGTDLRANLQIRVKAEEQFRRTQAVSQISRAMNSQPRRFEVFVPGDLVYYRRYQVPHGQKPSRRFRQAKVGTSPLVRASPSFSHRDGH